MALHKLGDSIAGIYGFFFVAVIVQGDYILASIVAIAYAYAVCRAQGLFSGKTASCEDCPEISVRQAKAVLFQLVLFYGAE